MPTATIDENVTLSRASARHVRVTPQKARRIVDLIRGKAATEAVAVLRFAPQSASDPVRKVLESAIANARVTADWAFLPRMEAATRSSLRGLTRTVRSTALASLSAWRRGLDGLLIG